MAQPTDDWMDEDWTDEDRKAFEEELRIEDEFDGWDYDAGCPLPGYVAHFAPRLEQRCYTPDCGHPPDAHARDLPFNPCRTGACACPVLYQPYAWEQDRSCVCGHALRAHTATTCDWCDCEDGFSLAMLMPVPAA